ncbi:MAG: LamG domain-containing protein [Armatimonadota bacterium]
MLRIAGITLLLVSLLGCVCPVQGARLVGQWKFDEGAGTTAVDSSGNGATAVLHGATWSVAARYGKALYFNGTDASVEIPKGAWNRSAPLTLTCWYRNQGGGTLFDHCRAVDQPGCYAAYAGDGAFTGYDGTRTHIAGTKVPVVDDTWTFLTIAITPQEVRSYCNGILTGVTPLKSFPKLEGRLFLGARGEPKATFFFKGWLDEFSIFDDALSAEEVRALYTNGLIGYWKLNEGIGKTAYDYSGNQAIGEIVGTASWEAGEQDPTLRFDGKTGYVAIPNGAWNTAAPVTYLCWYKAENNGIIFDHGLGGAIAGAFAFGNGRFACYDSKITDIGGAGVPHTLNAWVFAAFSITPTEIRSYANGELKSTVPIKGFPRTAANLYIGARGEVPDGYLPGTAREMAVYNRALGPEEIAALYQNYGKGIPIFQPSTGLKILAVRPEKLLYRPADTGKVDVTVKNFGAAPLTATLNINLITRLATAQEAGKSEITLGAHETRLFTVPVPFAGQQFGCVTQATLAQGGAIFDRAEDVVSVTDNPWAVGVGGQLTPGEIGSASPKRLDEIIKSARNRYANWLEAFFWAPDDWANLNPTVEEWYAGQASYYGTRTNYRGLIDRAHGQGIKMVTYGKSTAGGPDGWEVARQRPDWFLTSNRGQTSGIYDVRMLDHWNDTEARKKGEAFDWLWLYPDCRRVDALDFGIKQIADSATNIGWDGVRFDGHFTTSSDAVSTWNMRRLKEVVWKEHPQFIFGYNYAFSPENYPSVTHEMREAMAGGGMWMQEAIKDFAYGDSLRYDHWTQEAVAKPAYAPHELWVVKQIQGMGGYYHCIYSLDTSPKSLYKLVYGLIAGGHSAYGQHEKVIGCENWGKFMTRWSTFLWNLRLQPVANAAEQVTVDAPGLYWQPLMQEFVDTPTRKYKILHLVNPSPDDLIDKTTLPAPVDNVRVRVKPDPGTQVTRVVVVRPESDPYDLSLQPIVKDGGVEFVVPRVNVWAMVILEESGAFTVPADTPAFTEPADPVQVAAGRKQTDAFLSNDPLQPPPVGLTLAANEQLYETDTGYNSVPAQATTDPDANNGRAQIRESGVKSVYYGRTWMGAFLPGRYQIRVRMKLTDEQQPPRRQSVSATIYINTATQKTTNMGFDSDPARAPEGRRLIIDGKYHDYVVGEVDLRETAMLHVIGGAHAEDPVGTRFYCDHFIITQLERYPDARLAEWTPPNKPAGLRTPQGRTPQKVLHVRGMYWSMYALEKLPIGCTGAYALPAKYEELYAYDVVVLTNIDLISSSFSTRRMLCDFVEDGGRLVFLGGPNALGQGGLTGTCLEEILPFTLKGPEGHNGVVRCETPLLLGLKAGKPWPDKPALFWRHEVKLKPGAFPVAYAGATPIAARTAYGKGLVVTFAGTVLGTPPAGVKPFWQTTSWWNLLGQLVLE